MNLFEVKIQAVANVAEHLYIYIISMRDEPAIWLELETENYEWKPARVAQMRTTYGPVRTRARSKRAKPRPPLTLESIQHLPEAVQAVVLILMEHSQDKPFSQPPVDIIFKTLNQRFNDIHARSCVSPMVTDPPWYLLLWAPVDLFIAQDLVTYLNYFAEEPRLVKHKPFGFCTTCRSLFLKSRTDQNFCSSDCRQISFRAKKSKEDPKYWAKAAARSRAARAAMRKARRKV